MLHQGFLLVISGPSGAGKSTIAQRVREALGAHLSVSMTTRDPGPGDVEGRDYYFVDRDRFERAIAAEQLLEWAQVYGNYYGTPRAEVEQRLASGESVLLEIDIHGAKQVKQARPDAFAVYILPPSEEALLQRLRSRRREDEAAIQRRFTKAKSEIAQAREGGIYDAFVVNDDLERAVAQTLDAVKAERLRRGG